MSYSTMVDLIVNGTVAGVEVWASNLETDEQHPLLAEARRIADEEGWEAHNWELFRDLLAGAWMACDRYTEWLEPALLRLTDVFPDLVIGVRGMGEDFDDMWRKYYYRGRTYRKEPTSLRMCLVLPDADNIEDPAPDDVLAAIDELDHRSDSPFLILEDVTHPHTFMQVLKKSPRLHRVEYSEGTPQRLYCAPQLAAPLVRKLFLSYLSGRKAYKRMVAWKDITREVFGSGGG